MDIQILAQKFYDHSLYFKGYSVDTIRKYKYVINLYCKYSQIYQMQQITEANVRALFFHGRTERNWSVNTFLCFYKCLLVFFRWCVESAYLDHNPVQGIQVPKLERKLPRKLTKQEALRLIEVVYNYPYEQSFLRYRNHAIFSMFVFAGLRKNELLHLTLSDVDTENLTIFIRQGKGRKDRIVPISYTLAQSLNRYLGERKRLNKSCPEYFVSIRGNMGFTQNGLKWLVNNIRRASGMQFTIHQLRHTFATLMLEGGCDIYSLSKMMGHSDINTTTIYLSASAEHLRKQISKHPMND
jgi:site-specific recombinase XerD